MTFPSATRVNRAHRSLVVYAALVIMSSPFASVARAADPEVAITTRDGERVIVTLDEDK